MLVADPMSTTDRRVPEMPVRIEGLWPLATNLSWSWNRKTRALFRMLDNPLWQLTRHNPIDLLRRIDPARLKAAAEDAEFLRQYDLVIQATAREMASKSTWFGRNYPDVQGEAIAYFCAEFGLHSSVPIYSGGLGVLAGDHCKEASDLGVPLVGVGLFYRRGYFDQRVTLDGWQEDSDMEFDPLVTPAEPVPSREGRPWLATVQMFGRTVHIGVYRMMVGRAPIYLLDTNLEENDPADRTLSSKLYAGGPDLRIAQEWILGTGGVRVLRALGIQPRVWHANEGHCAFMLVERVRELVQQGVGFDQAVAEVRRNSVFTTHTPVPAGHDIFMPEQIEHCMGAPWNELGIDRDRFLSLGYHPEMDHGRFHMTATAIRLAEHVNGVSELHGKVSRKLWQALWPERAPEAVPIGQITNGVHLPTWMSHNLMELLDRHLGADWQGRLDSAQLWDAVLTLDDDQLWAVHKHKKEQLFNIIREEARLRFAEQWKESAQMAGAGTLLDPDALTIGFARRFATYKRANLLFHDVHRLRRLLVNPWRPVQLVFSGKAHPADHAGKEALQSVYRFTRDPWFQGRIAFMEDYDLHISHCLVQGVDLWLNLPRVPMEACGTSGMKASLNAVPQVSTLDGWWAEGYDGTNGWALPAGAEGEAGDAADADAVYSLLENEVVPLFYERDEDGVPRGYLMKMKNALRVGGSRFSARQMVQRYVRECYLPGEKPADAR